MAPKHARSGSPGWVRRLWTYVRPHRRNVGIAFAAALVGTTVAALTPLVQKVIVDDIVDGADGSLVPWLVLLVVAGLVRFGTAFVRRYVGGRVSLDVQHDLRRAIHEKLQRLDPSRYESLQTGQLVSRAGADVNLVQGLLSFLPIVTGNVLLFVLSIVVMLMLSPPLTLVALAVGPVLFVIGLRLRRSVYPATWDAQQQAGVVAGVVDEAVAGVRVVKGFGQEELELEKLGDAALGLYRRRVRAVHIQARYQPMLQAVPVIGQVAILAAGGWLAIRGSISLGTFLAFTTYLGRLTAPVRMLAGLLAVGQQARAGVERIAQLLDTRPAIVDQPDAIVLPALRGDVTFRDVSFAYRDGPPVLEHFDLHVRPGETVALVGASGSGKSTLALLVPRFYDVTEGAVLVDGVDVRDAALESLRSQIGVVFEEPFLFSDSVRANIAYGRPDASDEEISAAARAVDADEFIRTLPDGYDTVVGERGLTLSGGQRQRVALARALLTDPRILVLDDATSAIDARTEAGIHATLQRLMEGRTTLLVAHRRSTLRLASRIVVVEHGRVLGQGTHDELMHGCARYRELITGDGGLAQADFDEPSRPPLTVAAAPMMRAGRRGMVRGGGPSGPGGDTGFLGEMAATPELEEAVQALPPADDEPRVDVAAAAAPDPGFSLRSLIRPFRRAFAVGAALVVADALTTLAIPALVRYGVDNGIDAGATDVLFATAGVALVITVVGWLTAMVQTRVTGRTAERLLYSLRIRIFAHLQRLALDYYERELAGRIMTRMTSDVDALAQVLQTGLVTALVNAVAFLGVGVALLVLDARLALVAFTMVPPLLVATLWFRARSARAYDLARDRVAVVNAELQESLSGVRVTQAFTQEANVAGRFTDASLGYVEARLGAQRLVATYFPFVEFLSEVSAALVLGFGASLVGDGALTAGALLAFLLYLDLFFSPVQQLSQVFDSYQQARISLRRIGELMRTETATPEPIAPVPMPSGVGARRGMVRFEGVRFAYPGTGSKEEALRGVDLDVAPGEVVALVGATGAGKSTIVKLVARFYDVSAGRVLVDGVDLRDLDLTAHRHRLGYVPQEAFLFSGTVRENIAYGRPGATDAEVEAAARAVGADALVATLEGGYDHPVAERGRSLSAGQRQLLCLARARLVDPDILLLDEATANLDLLTEARVSAAMGAAAAGRTTLVIAHRLPTAAAADRIVVLDHGRIVEQGTHAELRHAEGPYAAAWAAFEGGDLREAALAD